MTNFEQVNAVRRANAEILAALMRTAFTGFEKLTALNVAASRELMENMLAGGQKAIELKDPVEFKKAGAAFAQPNLDKLIEYSRDLYELSSQMQKEIAAVIETQYATFSRKANAAIDKTTEAAPIGGDVFSAAMKSMLSASTRTFDNMSSIAKQLADIAETNVQAASNATAKTLNATAVAARKGSIK